MKITLVLACLGVATFAATVAFLHLARPRRRMVVVVHGPADWTLAPARRAGPAPTARNRAQPASIPHRRAAA